MKHFRLDKKHLMAVITILCLPVFAYAAEQAVDWASIDVAFTISLKAKAARTRKYSRQ